MRYKEDRDRERETGRERRRPVEDSERGWTEMREVDEARKRGGCIQYRTGDGA